MEKTDDSDQDPEGDQDLEEKDMKESTPGKDTTKIIEKEAATENDGAQVEDNMRRHSFFKKKVFR